MTGARKPMVRVRKAKDQVVPRGRTGQSAVVAAAEVAETTAAEAAVAEDAEAVVTLRADLSTRQMRRNSCIRMRR